jgi:surfeit locus 1 family protein
MKPRSIVIVALVLIGAAGCVRLGFWQIERWHEKRALNAALRAALDAEPVRLGARFPAFDLISNRKIEIVGRFDERRQVLLGGRVRAKLPGVEVITPLLLEGDSVAVLVDRGWVYAPDAIHARPQDFREPHPRPVTGIAHAVAAGSTRLAVSVLERDSSVTLWSARTLDLDSLRSRLPYALAPFLLVELPGKGVPDKPLRGVPQPLDEFTHVSYAIQWFLFGVILLGGSALLARSRRRRRPAPTEGPTIEVSS